MFYQNFAVLSCLSACFAGEWRTKGRNVWKPLVNMVGSTCWETKHNNRHRGQHFYFCFATSWKMMCMTTHTHTNTLDDKNSYSVAPLFTPEITPCQSGFFFLFQVFDWQFTLWGCLKRRSSSVVCQTGDIKKKELCERKEETRCTHQVTARITSFFPGCTQGC